MTQLGHCGQRGEDRRERLGHGCRGDKQRTLCGGGKCCCPTGKRLLEPRGHAQRLLDWLGSCELFSRERARQLNQRERVAGRRGMECFGDAIGDVAVYLRQKPGGIRGAEPLEPRFGKPGCFDLASVALADREDDRDRVGFQATSGEEQRVARGGVEPLGVVDEHQQGRLLGGRRDQAEHGGADREAIAGSCGGKCQCATERGRLGFWDRRQDVEDRPRDQQQPREGQLCLGLDAARVQDRHVAGPLRA